MTGRCEAVAQDGTRICDDRALYFVDGTYAACVNHYDGRQRGLRFRVRRRDLPAAPWAARQKVGAA
jgi:hypothetical protein